VKQRLLVAVAANPLRGGVPASQRRSGSIDHLVVAGSSYSSIHDEILKKGAPLPV